MRGNHFGAASLVSLVPILLLPMFWDQFFLSSVLYLLPSHAIRSCIVCKLCNFRIILHRIHQGILLGICKHSNRMLVVNMNNYRNEFWNSEIS